MLFGKTSNVHESFAGKQRLSCKSADYRGDNFNHAEIKATEDKDHNKAEKKRVPVNMAMEVDDRRG